MLLERILLGQLPRVADRLLSSFLGHLRRLVGPLVFRTPTTNFALMHKFFFGFHGLAIHFSSFSFHVLQATLELGLLFLQVQYSTYFDVGR